MSSYLFHAEASELAAKLLTRAHKVQTQFQTTGVLTRARKAYHSYHGQYFRATPGHQLGRAGEQGEYTTLAVNHFRNLIQHTLSLLSSNRLAFDCLSEATDVEARNACIIGNNLLDSAFYEDRIDVQINRLVELGLIMGTSYISVEWNPYDKLIGQDGEGIPVYSGRPRVRSHTIFDVILEPFEDDDKRQNWMCLREIWNRHDLVRLFPEMEEEILALPRIKDLAWYDPYLMIDEDHVFVFKAWHRETPALPLGRETWFCEGDCVLKDGVNPYVHPSQHTPNGGMPLFCFRPAVQYASAYGHSIAFDLLPLQEALNILDSSIITNQDNYAVQNIISARESSVSTTDLAGGNRLVEYTPIPDVANGGKPEVLQLCATPAEVFSYRKEVIQNMEIISGINAVLRGQPQASLISGTALALVATQANTFNTNLENNYVHIAEDVAHFLLYIISRFQTTEELVSMIGKGKSNEVRSFKGSDLSPIRKVKVLMGNALARTTAGKVEIAELLVNAGVVKTPEGIIEALQTGQVSNTLDNAVAEPSFIKFENEEMLRGVVPPVSGLDNHPQHILEHRALTFNPQVRRDPKLLQAVLQHIQQHMDQFDQMAMGNPTLLNLVMGQPLPMPAPAPESGVGPGAQAQPMFGQGQPQGEGIAQAVGETVGGNPNPSDPQALATKALKSAENKLQG